MKTKQNCICEAEVTCRDETVERSNELLKQENLVEFDSDKSDSE